MIVRTALSSSRDMTRRFSRILFNIRRYSWGLAFVSLLIARCSSLGKENSYSCKDRDRKPSFGNGPPGNECAKDIFTYINGITKCDTDPAPEPEEKSRNPQADKDHQQWLSDIALLDRYSSEEQSEADREADLQPVRQCIADGVDACKRPSSSGMANFRTNWISTTIAPYPVTLLNDSRRIRRRKNWRSERLRNARTMKKASVISTMTTSSASVP